MFTVSLVWLVYLDIKSNVLLQTLLLFVHAHVNIKQMSGDMDTLVVHVWLHIRFQIWSHTQFHTAQRKLWFCTFLTYQCYIVRVCV